MPDLRPSGKPDGGGRPLKPALQRFLLVQLALGLRQLFFVERLALGRTFLFFFGALGLHHRRQRIGHLRHCPKLLHFGALVDGVGKLGQVSPSAPECP
jgi:hypothetical protein